MIFVFLAELFRLIYSPGGTSYLSLYFSFLLPHSRKSEINLMKSAKRAHPEIEHFVE